MITIAAIQRNHPPSPEENREASVQAVRDTAEKGAHIILLSELFDGPYFCKTQTSEPFALAAPWKDHPLRKIFAPLAKELNVVLPISFYEREGQACFNSVAILDADGETLGVYRKSHIPQGPGYEEKFYFSPGDTGFKVWNTKHARIGVGICWDQWFPEAARCMALMGAEVLLYPTAIGSEPENPEYDSASHWQMTQRGHAAANMIPLVAANRIGTEIQQGREMTFYGSSFIAGPHGELLASASRDREEILLAEVDPEAIATERMGWGLFRDRRPELYGALGGY
jgi:N-carbamoylputrescine amidase